MSTTQVSRTNSKHSLEENQTTQNQRESKNADSSLAFWETIFRQGGSKAIEISLIQLRKGSDKYSRLYLFPLGCITAARSLAEAPVALGRLVFKIAGWAI